MGCEIIYHKKIERLKINYYFYTEFSINHNKWFNSFYQTLIRKHVNIKFITNNIKSYYYYDKDQ